MVKAQTTTINKPRAVAAPHLTTSTITSTNQLKETTSTLSPSNSNSFLSTKNDVQLFAYLVDRIISDPNETQTQMKQQELLDIQIKREKLKLEIETKEFEKLNKKEKKMKVMKMIKNKDI